MKKLLAIIFVATITLVGCSNSDEDNQKSKENQTSNAEVSAKKFLEKSYTMTDIKQWEDFEDMATVSFRNQVKNQNQSYQSDDITKEVETIKIYQEDNSKKSNLMYEVDLKTTNDDKENIDYTKHYGKLSLEREDNKLKVNSLKEIGNEEYNN